MSRHTPEQIEELLRGPGSKRSPEPPADLLEEITRDSPGHLAVAPEEEEPRPPSLWVARRTQLIAASLFLAVAATVVTTRVLLEEPTVRPEVAAFETQQGGERAEQTIGVERVATTADAVVESVSSAETGASGEIAADRKSTPAAAGEVRGGAGRSQPDGEDRVAAGVDSVDTFSATEAPPVRKLAQSPPATIAETLERDESARSVPAESDQVAPTADTDGSREERSSLRDRIRAEREAREVMKEKLSSVRTDTAGPRRSQQERPVEPEPEAVFGIPESPLPVAPPPAVVAEVGNGSVQRPAKGRTRRPEPASGASTGGTAEPNDRPYGDVFFEPTGVNPFIDTEDDNLSTFGLDVDTGSYTVARRYLEDGNLPPAAAIRVEEFINYFDYGDPAPRRGDFAIAMEGAPSPFADGPRYQLLRFGITARDVSPRERRPATLIFVVDTSGSMEHGDRIGLVKRALTLLLDELGREDRVGLVEYSTRARVLLEPTRDKLEVERALRRLVPHGSTNAEEGLLLGYELADEYFRRGGINRVILCSDGVANVGRTGPDSILERIEREAGRGIEITTVGFGMGNYNDLLMEQLADRGNGRYAYVDNLQEAQRIFVEDLTGTLQTVARDAKAQVEFRSTPVRSAPATPSQRSTRSSSTKEWAVAKISPLSICAGSRSKVVVSGRSTERFASTSSTPRGGVPRGLCAWRPSSPSLPRFSKTPTGRESRASKPFCGGPSVSMRNSTTPTCPSWWTS
jgi:Mg-chelatase subunit ChlD